MADREHPPAYPHGDLEEVFDDVFFVTGTVKMGGFVPMAFSRNMTVVRQGGELSLIGSMRLDDAGLAKLEALGEVKHVLRVAGFHGMDDPFYKERYGAKVWAVEGSAYASGFSKDVTKSYFEPDVWMNPETELPIEGATLFRFDTTPAEGIIRLDREGGILVTGDALQNWAAPDEYMNFPARLGMRLMGFFKPNNVGPGWVKEVKPDPANVRTVLDLEFEHLLPVHGAPVRGGAREKFRPAIEKLG